MKKFDLIGADGTKLPLNSRSPLRAVTSAVWKEGLMGEDTVTLSVEAAEAIEFEVGQRMEVLGRIYVLNALPGVQRTARRHFTYTAVLEGAKYDLSRVVMMNEFSGGQSTVNETEFSHAGEFARLMDLVVDNLERVYGPDSWRWEAVDTGVDGDFKPEYGECKTLTFSSENALSALNTICGLWGAEFRIDRRETEGVIQVGRVGRNAHEYVFSYGKGNGLYKLSRVAGGESAPVTRLYAYGSQDNLGMGYRDRRRRLALPLDHESTLIKDGLYVQDDALAERFGLSEGAVVFDDVFPCREGIVSAVDEKDELKFSDGEMFDLNEKNEKGDSKYLLGALTPTVRFNTGALGGYEFSLAGYNTATHTFTVVPFTDENDYRYPSDKGDAAFRIAPGDKYVLLNISLPDSYVQDAEARLAEKALGKYREMHRGMFSYSLEPDRFFVEKYFPNARYAPVVLPGDFINVRDEELVEAKSEGLGEHTVAVKVSQVSVDLYDPFKYTLELSDSAPSSVLTQVIKSEKETEKVIRANDLSDPARARRNLRTTADLLEMTFDSDGYFTDGRIRPESIETRVIAVGALSGQFLLDGVVFSPNPGGNPNRVGFSAGTLTHLGLDKVENRIWNLLPGERTDLEDGLAYYIYARCQKEGTAGTMVIDPSARRYDADAEFYYFPVGVLGQAEEGFRRLSLTYGSSTINGREITTGRISASAGQAYFDLDAGEIGGKIVFTDKSEFRDASGKSRTLIEGGKINADLLDVRRVEAESGHMAQFEIQADKLVGDGGTLVFQNSAVSTLGELLGEKDPQWIDLDLLATSKDVSQSNTMHEDTLALEADLYQEIASEKVPYAGFLRFAIAGAVAVSRNGTEGSARLGESVMETRCEVVRIESGVETVVDGFSPAFSSDPDKPVKTLRNTYLDRAGQYAIRYRYRSQDRPVWIDKPEGWPDNVYPQFTKRVKAAIVAQDASDRDRIKFTGSDALTAIGTDGFFSFWSALNYLYFSKDQGLRIAADTKITSPDGNYSLTVNNDGISISGPVGTDASNNTVAFSVAGTRVNIMTGEKLSEAFGKIAKWLGDLHSVAFSGDYTDLKNKPTIPTKLPADGGHADTATKATQDAAGRDIAAAYATKESLEGMQIGGTNLALNSKYPPLVTNTYRMTEVQLSRDIADGEKITLSIDGSIAADHQYYIGLYPSTAAAAMIPVGKKSVTFAFKKNPSNPGDVKNRLILFNYPNTGNLNSTLNSVKVEVGDKATDWSPAPQELARVSDIAATYAPLNSPALRGNPTTLPPDDSNPQGIANVQWVIAKIAKAIGDIHSFEVQVVESLPETGVANVIYFVRKNPAESADNVYDEYLWLNNAWEHIGDTKVDLSDYAQTADIVSGSIKAGKAAAADTADDSNHTNQLQAFLNDDFTLGDHFVKAIREAPASWNIRLYGCYKNGAKMADSIAVNHANSADTATKAAQDGSGRDIAATYAEKTALPVVTYGVNEPANPKNGDIWIVPTD